MTAQYLNRQARYPFLTLGAHAHKMIDGGWWFCLLSHSSFGLIPMVTENWACETLEVCVSIVGDSYEDVRCHPRGSTEG